MNKCDGNDDASLGQLRENKTALHQVQEETEKERVQERKERMIQRKMEVESHI